MHDFLQLFNCVQSNSLFQELHIFHSSCLLHKYEECGEATHHSIFQEVIIVSGNNILNTMRLFVNHISDRDLYTKYIKNSYNSIIKSQITQCKNGHRGFPGGAVVESPPANAGDTGSSPGLGGSHMPRSSWAREPQLLSLRVWSLCSAIREAAIVRGPRTAMKSGPRSPQLEKALAQKRRPNTTKNK